MNNTTVSPAEYFEQVKSRKQTMTAAGLSQLYENCIALLEEYQRSGQIAAQKKLLFHIDNITREKKLLDLGIDTFVYKSDVDEFIHMVDNKVVKIVELDNYQRRIPEEIIHNFSPVKATLLCYLLNILTATFLGLLIFFVILWDNRSKDLTKITTEINAIILTFYFGLFY